MNRRKFLKALFSIPLLAVVPKMAVEEKKPTGQQADITVLDDPEDKWEAKPFYHPNEGLCEFPGLRGFITTGKERLKQLDDYSKAPFMDIQTSIIMPKNRMLLACKSDVKGHLTWISNDDGLTWEALDGTELPKPTA